MKCVQQHCTNAALGRLWVENFMTILVLFHHCLPRLTDESTQLLTVRIPVYVSCSMPSILIHSNVILVFEDHDFRITVVSSKKSIVNSCFLEIEYGIQFFLLCFIVSICFFCGQPEFWRQIYAKYNLNIETNNAFGT